MTPTPKQKAEELIEKFYQNAPKEFGSGKALAHGRSCAIISVDEIIQVIDDFELSNHGKIGNSYGQEFWYEVKKELEKM